MNYDRASQDSLLGTITIPLSMLKDQYPRTTNYTLLGYNHSGVGTILLSLQWLHSQEKYLSETLIQWDEHIRQQEEDLIGYEQDLACLYKPFPAYLQLIRNDINNNPSNQQQQQVIQQQMQQQQQPGLLANKQAEYQKIDLRGASHQEVIEVDKNLFSNTLILIGIFSFLVLLAHFYRPIFLDWAIAIFSFMLYWLHLFDHHKAKLIFIAIVVAIAIDFFWIFIYSSGWWQSTDDIDESIVDSAFRKFSVCISYLTFLIKVPLAYVVFLLWQELEKQLSGKTVVKEKLMSTLAFNRSPEYAAAGIPFGNSQVPPQGYINRQHVTDNSVIENQGQQLGYQPSQIVASHYMN